MSKVDLLTAGSAVTFGKTGQRMWRMSVGV
jgi:hypothetical protein